MTSSPRESDLAAYERVRSYVDVEVVRLTPRPRDRDRKVATALRFNAQLGDPQAACPSIQVAGTSGKGSVCALIAGALHAAGLRTGLHVSPYLQVFTEKTWIDGRHVSPAALEAACAVVRPVTERFRHDDDCPASVHGLTSLAISYEAFRAAGCEVVVQETGCGGRFDLVQGLDLAGCVITDLALDHIQALGPTLEEIAWHKAGILRAGVPAVAIRGPGIEVIEAEAKAIGAPLTVVEPADLITARRERDGALDLRLRLPRLGQVDLALPLASGFQERNAALAAAALDALVAHSAADWPITADHLREGFTLRLPGRAEVMQDDPSLGPRVVLDGAHNPHKLAALLAGWTEPPAVVMAVSGQRTPTDLLASLLPLRPRLIATGLDLYGKASIPADELADAARSLGLEATAIPIPEAALDHALANPGPGGVLITGSIFLAGRLRSRWFPWQQVLSQGTSWPIDPH